MVILQLCFNIVCSPFVAGRVGFTGLLTPARPSTTRPEDVYTADAYNDLQAGLVFNSVVHGDWPQVTITEDQE